MLQKSTERGGAVKGQSSKFFCIQAQAAVSTNSVRTQVLFYSVWPISSVFSPLALEVVTAVHTMDSCSVGPLEKPPLLAADKSLSKAVPEESAWGSEIHSPLTYTGRWE